MMMPAANNRALPNLFTKSGKASFDGHYRKTRRFSPGQEITTREKRRPLSNLFARQRAGLFDPRSELVLVQFSVLVDVEVAHLGVF